MTPFYALAPPTRIAPLPALTFQPGSGGQKVQEHTGEQPRLSPSPLPSLPRCNPSHEVTALGSILMHLALISPVWPSRQLSRSLQSPARVSTAQLPMATAKRSHCGHVEDIPDTALGRPGGAFNVGHSSHLLGQHSTLEKQQMGGNYRPSFGKEREGCGLGLKVRQSWGRIKG